MNIQFLQKRAKKVYVESVPTNKIECVILYQLIGNVRVLKLPGGTIPEAGVTVVVGE